MGLLGCVHVVSWIVAWPLAKYRLEMPIGLKMNHAATGDHWALTLWKTALSMLFADTFSYWKHRLFHHPSLYIFHKQHHSHHNPSTFASFALHPFEALLTFSPMWLLTLPGCVVWAPSYFAHVVGFSLLNLYLHCGY